MADPHNPQRYGEVWAQHRVDAYLEVLRELKHYVVLSGGWAWHFLSPVGHTEYRHAHDHSDCDLMVPPHDVGTVMSLLNISGFRKVQTKYDRLPSEEQFRRYECNVAHVTPTGESDHGAVGKMDAFRLTIDFFVKNVPTLQTPDGWVVVRPDELLTYYSTIHSSKSCWAVQAAQRLFDAGATPESLIGNPDLMGDFANESHGCRDAG